MSLKINSPAGSGRAASKPEPARQEVSPVLAAVLGALAILAVAAVFWYLQAQQARRVAQRDNPREGIRKSLQDPTNQSRLKEILSRKGDGK